MVEAAGADAPREEKGKGDAAEAAKPQEPSELDLLREDKKALEERNLRLMAEFDNYRKRKAFLEEIKHAVDSDKALFCFFYGVTPELKQVPGKKNPEKPFEVFNANIENLDHFIIREAPGLE